MNDVWRVEEIERGPNTLSDVNGGFAAIPGGTNPRGLIEFE